jgi:translation initiation factor 3 subunit M
MTTLVETSDEEPTLAVARTIAELAWGSGGAEIAEPEIAHYVAEAELLLLSGRFSDLASLLLTSADLVLANAPEKDLECIFTVISNLVSKVQTPDEALAMADQIGNKLFIQPIDKPTLRLKILFHLYNILGNPYGRFLTFKRALKLAILGKVTELVVPSLKRLDALIKEWNIGNSDKRELYLTSTNILKDIKGSSKESFSYLVKYLSTFAGEDAATLSEAKDDAVRAVIEFVKAPDSFQSDLLDLAAVRQLDRDPKTAPVYRLLEIFLTSHLDAYLEFQSANAALLKSYGLVHEDSLVKMRLGSLTGLASKGAGEIPYAVVRDTLKITDDEVEYWIVRAISSKLLEAKMDQQRQVVVIR